MVSKMDLQKAIRIAVETGKTKMGSRQGKTLALKGGAALLLISVNCPKNAKEEILHDASKSKTPCYEANLTSIEIGSVCGKPFPVSILSIIEPGNSEILKVLDKEAMVEAKVEKETATSMKKRRKERKAETEAAGPSESEEDIEGKRAEAEQ